MVVRPDGAGALAGNTRPAGSASLQLLKNGGNLNSAPFYGGTVPSPAASQRTPTSSAAPYYGGSVPSPAASQARPIPGGYAPLPSGRGVDTSRPLGVAPAPQQAQQIAAYEPPAPRGPAAGGRQAYEAMDAGGRAVADEQWLGGDADYTAQLGEYDRALQDFIDRITGQKDNFELDRKNANSANMQNETMSTNQLGEDFGARGMSYSGLVDKSMNDLRGRFSEQGKNIDLVAQRNKDEADTRQADYSAENSIGRGNAKRSALARMANQQSIIDSNSSMF